MGAEESDQNMSNLWIQTMFVTLIIGIVTISVCHAAPIELVGDVINEVNPDGYDLM